MYADFEYYQTVYGGAVFGSAPAYEPYRRKAERRIDLITTEKLSFAFPVEEKAADTVRDTVCEMAEFLYQVDCYKQAADSAVGIIAQSDGTVKGKVIKSVSSGAESVTYSSAGDIKTAVSEAARDRKVLDTEVYSITRSNLAGVADANGINLLYAGPYPGRRCLWE